jgi:hypothetical protein
VEHGGGGINGAEEQEDDEGYSTPTSPSSRLRVPDVCPGAPTIRLDEEEEGYGTPTSPSSRLRVPAVCPGAPRIPMEGPSTSMMETTGRAAAGIMRAPLRMWVCAVLLCVYRHIRKST